MRLWDMLTRLMVIMASAGVLGLFVMAWVGQGNLAAIRQDIAVIKSTQVSAAERSAERIIDLESRLASMAERLRSLETAGHDQ